MKTPKNYTENLKKGIITMPMLSDCLFSVNKRAKNCRDQERYYRNSRYDYYHNEEKNRTKKESYYAQKERMLGILQPECIHKEIIQSRERFYDYEPEYDEYLAKGLFFHEGGFYDNDIREYVCFGDAYVDEPRYYIFYNLGDHSFHTPIEEYCLEKYSNLAIVDIDSLVTTGKEITDLISAQFVQKVLTLIESGKYQLVA